MLDYTKIESRLKSFLKNNKRLSFFVALLVTFLINGDFSYTDEALKVPVVTRQELQDKIIAEQDNVAQLIKDTERNENEIELKIKKLTQRAEFWVKPLDKSYQLFFIADWGKFSRNRSNTASNFNGVEYSTEVGQENGYGQYANGKYLGMYGIVKNPIEFVDKIDFGANITPKSVPEKTIVEKSVSKKVIIPPTVDRPEITVGSVQLAPVSPLQIGTMRAPNQPTVNVSAPGAMPSLGAITVSPVTALNISPNPPTVGEAPTVEAPTVQPPATPAGFTPRLVSPPVIEEKKVNDPRVPNPPATNVNYQDVPNNSTGWYGGTGPSLVTGNNGLISQLNLIAGKFEMYFRGHGQGQDHKFTEADDSEGVLPSTYSVNGMPKVAFYGIGGKSLVTIPNTVTIKAVGNNSTNSSLNAIFYLGNQTTVVGSESKLINKATVNLYGNKIVVSNIDNVSSAGDITFLNEGNIIGYAEAGEYDTGKVGSNTIGNFIFGGYSYGDRGVDTIENGASGKVIFYAPNSVGWAYTSSATQAIKRSSINNGVMKLYGHHSLGIATDGDVTVEQMSWADIQLNKPIEILGDQSVGASIKTEPDETKSTNFFNSTWNIKIGGLDKVQAAGSGDEIYDTKTSTSKAGDTKKVEQSIGLNFDFTFNTPGINERKINKYKVSLEADADSSTGIRVGKANINLTDADTFTQVKINGTNNIGLLSDGADAVLKYTNTRNALNLDGGSGNILFATINSGKLNVENEFKLKTSTDSEETTGDKFVSTYAKGSGSVVTLEKGISFKHTGAETIGMYATDSGKITVTNPTPVTLPAVTATTIVDNSTLPSVATTPTISSKLSITGAKSVGFYSSNGGLVENKNSSIKVTDGSALAYAKGTNSKITVSNSLLDYSGEGYSLYTENGGKIDADNSVLVLRGKAVGMRVTSATNGDISFANGKIVMMSNDAIPFVASDITTTVNASNILTGLGLPSTITIAKGKEGTTVYNKYKIAAVDGMTKLNIDQDLDKKYATDDANETSSDLSKKASYDLFRRYLIQRAKVEVNGHKIKAVLDDSDLTTLDTTQTVGLEMNSSKNATSKTETSIDLKNNAEIIADKKGSGSGAVGAYINYGLVNIDATSKIEVEKDATTGNTANDSAVGVYAVNGSEVSNAGTITVGGNQSIGILGLAYREALNNVTNKIEPVVNEFGTTATNQRKIKIKNTKDIDVSSGENTVGIYAMNNNTSSAVADHTVENTGNIIVGNSTGTNTSIGIYSDKAKVLPKDGTIKIGEKAVGIYAKDSIVGATGDNLGNIDFAGEKGVGIYLKDTSTLLGNKVTLKQTTTGTLKGKVGILADSLTNKTLTTEVVADTGVNDVIAYYSKGNGTLTVQADISLNKNSTGISGENTENLVYSGSKTMKLGEGSTGIFGQKNIDFASGSNIELNGNSTVGVFAKGTSGVINSEGNIKFTKENSIGLYGSTGATINDKTALMDFSSGTAKNNIGVYLAGAKWIDTRTVAYTFNSDHEKNNIYLFAQGANNGTNDLGSTATLNNNFNVAPGGTASSTNKTIGMYFDTAVKGKTTFVDNTLDMTNGKVVVTNKGIGIYTKNGSTDKNNIINKIAISSTGDSTVGLFTDGNLKLTGTSGKVEALNQGIGLYGNNGKITIENTHKVEVTSAGTGMYLTGESYLDGGKLELENKTTGTTAAAIYYKKGTSSNEVNHNTDLTTTAGNDLLALYADGGVKLNNNNSIVIDTGKNNVGSYVTGGSIFNNKGSINLGTATGTNLINAIGIYVADGEATNTAGKTIEIYDRNNVGGSSLSVGMLAKANAGATATIKNAGNINVTGEAVGMNVDDNSTGINSGNITAKENNNLKAIGAHVNGANAKFTNSGTISADNIALALKSTTATKITNSGTLKLTKTGAVGVYADDSIVDFNIAPTVATGADGTVALYATGNTKIKSQITSVTGKSHIGVYAEGNAEFQSGSKVIVGNGIGNDYGIGIYTKAGYNKAITSNIDLNGAETIGLYLGNDTVSSTGSTVNHTGTINVGSGIGVFIPQHSKFVAQNTTFNVNGGTAVYLKGGEVDLGSTGTATINFTGTGGRGIFQDGGTITTGSGLNIVGSGSFLTLKNANSTINSVLTVGTEGIGINGIFDAIGKDYTLTLDSPNGHIKLNGNKAKGIIAVAEPSVAPNKVDIVNKGTIETISGAETTGIYAKGANVHNQTGAKVNIGAKGVAIYTTNDSALTNTSLTNDGEIKLIGDEATGVMAIKANTTKDFVLGKINGTKDKLVGAYFENSVNPVKVKDFNINLGTNAKGLVFKEGKDFTIDTTTTNNKIAVGNTTGADRGIGIVALGVNGNVTKTDVTVGKNSLGLYVKDKKLTFDLANGKLESSDTNRSSILAYADGNTSEIALNGGGTLKVGKDGIAVGTKGGKITANATTTIEVDGVKGLGAYIENGETISSNFDVKVKSAEGIGMYAKGGTLTSVAKVSEIKGNKSKGYVFENITNALNIANPIQLTDINATEQVGVVVKGTGAGLTATGVSVIGSGNTGIYNETSGAVINNGTLTVGDSTGDSSIGIYSKGGAVTSTGNATIGKNSIAIYAKKTGVNFNGDITLDEKAIGLYIENDSTTEGDTNINGNVTVGSNGAIGVQATNSKINFNGDLSVATGDSKGIFSSETGDVITSGNITVADNSVGIYKSGNAEVKTTVGKTIAVADNGYGIFAKGGAKVTNNANVTVGEDSVGIYVDGNNLTSTADVTVADKGVGLLVKNGGTLTSTGNISLGSNNAVGLYADNSNIIQNGALNIGANDGIGIYSKGLGNISTVGNITVGNDAIGVYKTGKGLVNISSTMNIGDKGYGAYYVGTSKTDSTLNVTGNMTLGKEAVGVYSKNTTVNYNGDITVGETTIGSNGYNNPKVNKNSIGIFGDNSDINYTGNMLVEKPLSVGIYGANGGSITLKSGSTLTAKNGATGIMTGNGVSTITIESGATLNAIGKARDVDPNADTKNATFGISAFSGNIYNYGVINATTGATAIYKDGTAELKNRGTINIDPSSSVLGATPTKANADVGGVNIDISGKTTIGGKLINGGTVNIKGDLAMEGMGLDISTGKTVIDARTISGVAYVEPTFSKGNSEQKITVKDVFRIAPNGIGAFSGDVKSKSVSWIAKITKDPTDTTTATKDITMVKLPYTSLIAGEKYKNLATGLEDVRSKVGVKSESAIFKSLDNIDNHKDFATAVANIRGDIYSNIQERMKTVESAFDRSYDELLSSYNKTRNVNKYSIIHTAGEHEDGTVGVSGYKYKTVGALYVNDREGFTYGGKYGWSAGVVGTDFDFRGDTNKDSKERVISGKLGLHYQTALNKDDDNTRLKWLSRGEFTVNRHRTKRYGQIGADTYKHKATFYSTDLSWKNKVYYEYDVNTKWTVTPYAGLDMSYGHIFNIRENGENLGLEVKGKDYFVMTPNVGIETKYVLPVGTVHQLFVKADTRLNYDVVEMYRNPNQAKIREASSGYYDLSEPERRKARMAVGAEIGLEKENIYGLTFRAEYQGYKKSQLNYGVRLNYKF